MDYTVLYLRKQNSSKIRVFENGALRKIFGPGSERRSSRKEENPVK
jgi:hypothetical protein